MGTLSLSISARTNVREVIAELSRYPSSLNRATRDATGTAGRLASMRIAEKIDDIAGGVYWRIIRNQNPIPGGAKVRIRTPASKAHEIDPHGPYPLRFRGRDGRWVSTYHVSHPGSNPVDWVTPMMRDQHNDIERVFEERIARVFGGTQSPLPVGGR